MTIYVQRKETKDELQYVRGVLEDGGLQTWELKEYSTLEQKYIERIAELDKLIEEYEAMGGCQHPPARLYSWHVGDTLCVACCDCGAVLAGGAS